MHQTFLLQHETRQNTTKKSSEINNIGIIAPDNHRVKETTNTKFSYNEHERFADELKGKNPQIKILYTVGFAKHKRKCSQNKYFCYHCC